MKGKIFRLLVLSTLFSLIAAVTSANLGKEIGGSSDRSASRTPFRGMVLDRMPLANGQTHFTAFTSIDIPGAEWLVLTGINNRGQIVGIYSDETGRNSFLLEDGVMTTIEIPGMLDINVRDINNRGVIVGRLFDPPQEPLGFILAEDGTLTLLPQLWVPQGINDRGQVVGTNFQGEPAYGFLYDHGEVTIIEAPDAIDTWAEGINSRGQIVGFFVDTDWNQHGYIFEDGQFTIVDNPYAERGTSLNGINAAGQMVGAFGISLGLEDVFWRAFILYRGELTTFLLPNNPEAIPHPSDINNRGSIVGSYEDASGVTRGFLLE